MPSGKINNYLTCHFIGGPMDGYTGPTNVSTFPHGDIFTVRWSPLRPEWLAVYCGDVSFTDDDGDPVVMFAGWMTKDLTTGGKVAR